MKKVQEKIEYKSIFCYSYSTDSSLQKCVNIFLRNEYFGKYGWFKGTKVYFNNIVSKNTTLFVMKYAYLVWKNCRHIFRE